MENVKALSGALYLWLVWVSVAVRGLVGDGE